MAVFDLGNLVCLRDVFSCFGPGVLVPHLYILLIFFEVLMLRCRWGKKKEMGIASVSIVLGTKSSEA